MRMHIRIPKQAAYFKNVHARGINLLFQQQEVFIRTCSFTDFRKLSKRLEFSPLALDIVCIPTKSLSLKSFLKLKKDESGRRQIRLQNFGRQLRL